MSMRISFVTIRNDNSSFIRPTPCQSISRDIAWQNTEQGRSQACFSLVPRPTGIHRQNSSTGVIANVQAVHLSMGNNFSTLWPYDSTQTSVFTIYETESKA